MDIGNRIFNLLKAVANDKVEAFADILDRGDAILEETLRDWEKRHGLDQEKVQDKSRSSRSHHYQHESRESDQNRTGEQTQHSSQSSQLVDDLKLFELSPPVTLDMVKKARNREIKKFHPDKFLNEPEKMETAKRILQIYNAAFERIEKQLS